MISLANLPARLQSKIAVEPNTSCWLWTGPLNQQGYGAVWLDGATRRAHSAIYGLLVGPIPRDLTCDHLCRVRSCVNPKHIEPVTMRVNTMRGFGPTAINMRRTHCKRGHALDGRNLRIRKRPYGWRKCRECAAMRMREYRAAKLAGIAKAAADGSGAR